VPAGALLVDLLFFGLVVVVVLLLLGATKGTNAGFGEVAGTNGFVAGGDVGGGGAGSVTGGGRLTIVGGGVTGTVGGGSVGGVVSVESVWASAAGAASSQMANTASPAQTPVVTT
jgi:hypothetical protein